MADIRAIASTAFESPLTWFGNVVPGPNDVASSNGFAPPISTAIIVQALSNAAGGGAVAGGSFPLLNGGNVTFTNANGLLGSANNPVVTTASLALGQSASVSGPSANIPATAGILINHSGSGVLTVTSNLNGSTGQTSTGFGVVALTGVGVLNTIGTVTGPSNVVGNGTAAGVFVSGNGTWNHTGSIVGGTTNTGITAGAYITAASANVTINGSVTGGASTVFSNTARSPGVENASSSTLTINGQCQSSATQPAIGPGSINQVTRLSGPFLTGATGNINSNLAVKWGATAGNPASSMEVPNFNFTTKVSWYTANNYPVGGYPLQSNVVLGTVYGPNSEFTGTSARPATGSVAFGVAVGQATGTAILDGGSLRAALGMGSANLDTQFAGIPAAVWSHITRTLTSGGGGGGSSPTAAEIATEVWSTATRTLTTAFPSVPTASDIAVAVWSAATRTITNTIPSAIDIATAVWGAVTRTLTSSSAPTATDVATAVWSNTGRTITGGTVNTILDKAGYSLTSAERQAIATAVEQSILNETDGQAILNAIVGAIGNANVDQIALIAAIRADLERSGGMLAGRSTLTAGGVRAELSTELARLDVATSTRLASASYSAAPTTAAIRTELSVELARLDTPVSSRLAPSGTLARVTLTDTTTTLTSQPSFPATSEIASAVWSTPSRTVTGGSVDKTGYSLTSAERQAIATAVEQSILNESDGQAILNAIVGAIGNSSVDQVALVAAIRADMERAGGMLSGRSTLTAAQVWTHTSRTITGGTIDNASQTTIAAGEVAAAVRAELNPELERLRNCSTMDTTAAALANALKQ